ncbi:MAG TPA: glycosyltransferase [Saprospiraceae bacterium]|nr:glycosyltransferase [Saprospiraceae bacterium]
MIVFSILLSIVYAGMITGIFLASVEPAEKKSNSALGSKRFSIVVSARNEAHNIAACVQSLLNQQYPTHQFEVIVVDDHSTDGTFEIISSIAGIRALSLTEGQGKKAALALGISEAKFEIIATTDADCVVGPLWLSSLSRQFQNSGADLLTGPVKISPCDSTVSAFEAMDAAIMMKVTAAGIRQRLYFLANGANLAFTKKAYEEIGGYKSHIHHASGDDVFFYAEAARQKKRIEYVADQEAIVTTRPQPGWRQLREQRKRWATKTRAYAGRAIWMVQATVAITHAALLLMLFVALFLPKAGMGALIILSTKWVVDFIALWKATGWQNNRPALRFFIQGQIIYLYIILYSAWYALFPGEYKWKERGVR